MLEILGRLAPARIIAVIRAPSTRHLMKTVEVLMTQGIQTVEITLTTRGALDSMGQLRDEFADDLVVGAGTLRTARDARQSIDFGAQFLVSQVTNRVICELADADGVPYMPGALTPNEIVAAWEMGVPAVKVSPIAPVGGVAYLQELRGPLPDVNLMPTGGVTLVDAAEYLRAGAPVVGVSGHLLGDAMSGGDLEKLAKRAERLMATVCALSCR